MGGLRRRPRLLEVRRPHADHAEERRRPDRRLDLPGRRQQRLPVQSHRRRHHDVRAGEEPVARRARRDHRQGAVDPRRAARHRPARHQLLGEPRRPRAPADLPDQQQPPGHRRRHRQVDPDVRQRTASSTCAKASAAIPRWSAACSRARRARSSRTCCCSARRPAKATCRRRAPCAPSTSSPASWCGRSTRCRIRARRATRRGPRTPGSTSAAPTPGARSRSTRAAASPTSRPARRPTTTTAPIASAATSTRTA